MSDIIERLRPHSQIIMVSPEFCNEVIDEIDRLTAERDRALNRIAAMEGLQEQEPMVTKRKSGLILHTGWDPLPVGAKLYAAPMPPSAPAIEPNNDEVICPQCCHQFRAIPVSVQRLMLDAGFEPPFTEQPPDQIAPMPPSAPDGWQLVPVEPTDEMLKSVKREMSWCDPVGIFNKMLKAAPKPEDGK